MEAPSFDCNRDQETAEKEKDDAVRERSVASLTVPAPTKGITTIGRSDVPARDGL